MVNGTTLPIQIKFQNCFRNLKNQIAQLLTFKNAKPMKRTDTMEGQLSSDLYSGFYSSTLFPEENAAKEKIRVDDEHRLSARCHPTDCYWSAEFGEFLKRAVLRHALPRSAKSLCQAPRVVPLAIQFFNFDRQILLSPILLFAGISSLTSEEQPLFREPAIP